MVHICFTHTHSTSSTVFQSMDCQPGPCVAERKVIYSKVWPLMPLCNSRQLHFQIDLFEKINSDFAFNLLENEVLWMCYISPQQVEWGVQEPTALSREGEALVPARLQGPLLTCPRLLCVCALALWSQLRLQEESKMWVKPAKTISWGFRREIVTREAQNALLEKIREYSSCLTQPQSDLMQYGISHRNTCNPYAKIFSFFFLMFIFHYK